MTAALALPFARPRPRPVEAPIEVLPPPPRLPKQLSIDELAALLLGTPEGQRYLAIARELKAHGYYLVEHVVGRSAEGENRIAMTSRPDLIEERRAAARAAEACLLAADMRAEQWMAVESRVAP